MMDNPNNPEVQEQPSIPSSTKPRRSIFFIIIAIILVIIIVAGVLIIKLPSSPSPGPHLAFIPLNKAENLTGTTLTYSTVSYSSTSTSSIIKGEEAYFNNSFGGHIIIIAIQFSNISKASNFYNTTVSKASLNTSFINNMFKGFNYVYSYESLSNFYEGLAIGHSEQFVFIIFDINIPISSFNVFIQDQITAMT